MGRETGYVADQIKLQWAGEIAVCEAVFRLTKSCFVPEIAAAIQVAKLSEIFPKF